MVWEKVFKLLISLLWVAYLSRVLGPEDFGVYSYLFAIITMISTFPIFGMENVVIRSLVNGGGDNVLKIAFAIRMSFALLGAFFVVIACVLSDVHDLAMMFVFSLIIFLSLTVDLMKNYYQSKEMSRKYVFIDNISILISLCIKIYLLNNNYLNYPLLISLDFILSFCMISYFFFTDSKSLVWSKIKLDEVYKVLKQSFPFFISTIMVVIYSKIDQVMIKELLGYKELGYYSAALRVSSSWWVIPTTIVLALYPTLINKFNETKDEFIVVRYFSICTYITIFISFIVFLLADFLVITVFGSEYREAINVVKLHCFIGCLAALGVARSKWLIIQNLQKWLPLFVFSGMVINIIGNYFLINQYGVIGAVYSTFLAQISVLIFVPFVVPQTRETVILLVKGFNPANFIHGLKTFLK